MVVHHIVKYVVLFGCVFLVIIRTVIMRILKKPKVPSWPLKLELAVSMIEESTRVIDFRKDFSWKEVRFLQDISSYSVSYKETQIEKIATPEFVGEMITSKSIKNKPKSTVLYLHGGGHCVGSATSYRFAIANLSKKTESRFFLLEYGLSPEHRFPHSLEEAFRSYKWLIERYDPLNPIIIAGDSSGGGLAVSLLVLIHERGLPMPAGAVLISPWTNLSSESCMQNPECWNWAKFNFNPNNLPLRFAKAYLGDEDPKHPLRSPYYANLKGLPPILLMAGGGEVLLPDVDDFYQKCKDHNLTVTYTVAEFMPHVYPILYQGLAPEVDSSLVSISKFISDVC